MDRKTTFVYDISEGKNNEQQYNRNLIAEKISFLVNDLKACQKGIRNVNKYIYYLEKMKSEIENEK